MPWYAGQPTMALQPGKFQRKVVKADRKSESVTTRTLKRSVISDCVYFVYTAYYVRNEYLL